MDNVEAVEVAKGGYDLLGDLDRLVLLRGWRGREREGEREREREDGDGVRERERDR